MDASYTGKVISNRRKALDITQKELAERLNVTNKAVSRWENGLNFPDIAIMESLAKALDISVTELLGAENDSGDQFFKGFADISYQEKSEIAKEVVKRGWLIAAISLIFAVCFIYLDSVLADNLIMGLPRAVAGGMCGFAGVSTGSGIWLALKGKRLL